MKGLFQMKKENQRVEKLCSFYVSDWHFATMLLPYMNHQIEKQVNVITLLENNSAENIEILVKKLNLKNEEEILQIRWEEINSKKYADIEQLLDLEINKEKENIVLINGSRDYIERNNENIEKWVEKTDGENIKIINFFEVTEFNHHIVEILNSHDRVLNTSGEKEIAEVFEGYTKQEIKQAVGNV